MAALASTSALAQDAPQPKYPPASIARRFRLAMSAMIVGNRDSPGN
jgi:hypothetical protein